jgi:arabinofuranosyltransferase
MLCISFIAFFTREVYFTSIFFSIIASCVAIYILLFKISKNYILSIGIGMVLMLSKSFVSYTTSGLENCLIFLLLAIFYYYFFEQKKYDKKTLIILSLITALSLVNRMDSILFLAPSLCWAFFYNRKNNISFAKMISYGLIGMLPFILWELFAIIYYGFPFPNTAYAKLSASIETIEYVIQGIKYYIANFIYDPITLLSIFGVFVSVIIFKNTKNRLAFLGVVIYMLYIIKIGGDFMNGRFLSAPFFLSFIIISTYAIDYQKIKYYIFAVIILIMLPNAWNQLYESGNYGVFFSKVTSSVANEKSFYLPYTALKNNLKLQGIMSCYLTIDGLQLKESNTNTAVRYSIGLPGYYAGPKVKIIDGLALSDALLARMPVIHWRIGHIYREIPEGYLETIETGINQIKDENIREYYDKLSLVIKGKLFSIERIKTIIEMNLGKYDYLIKG